MNKFAYDSYLLILLIAVSQITLSCKYDVLLIWKDVIGYKRNMGSKEDLNLVEEGGRLIFNEILLL